MLSARGARLAVVAVLVAAAGAVFATPARASCPGVVSAGDVSAGPAGSGVAVCTPVQAAGIGLVDPSGDALPEPVVDAWTCGAATAGCTSTGPTGADVRGGTSTGLGGDGTVSAHHDAVPCTYLPGRAENCTAGWHMVDASVHPDRARVHACPSLTCYVVGHNGRNCFEDWATVSVTADTNGDKNACVTAVPGVGATADVAPSANPVHTGDGNGVFVEPGSANACAWRNLPVLDWSWSQVACAGAPLSLGVDPGNSGLGLGGDGSASADATAAPCVWAVGLPVCNWPIADGGASVDNGAVGPDRVTFRACEAVCGWGDTEVVVDVNPAGTTVNQPITGVVDVNADMSICVRQWPFQAECVQDPSAVISAVAWPQTYGTETWVGGSTGARPCLWVTSPLGGSPFQVCTAAGQIYGTSVDTADGSTDVYTVPNWCVSVMGQQVSCYTNLVEVYTSTDGGRRFVVLSVGVCQNPGYYCPVGFYPVVWLP